MSDSRVFWSSLPSPIHCLGKEVMVHRNTAFCSAMQALEEASAAEGIIHCMRLEHNSQLSDVLSILGIMFVSLFGFRHLISICCPSFRVMSLAFSPNLSSPCIC
nr:uncharacterized protein LOC109185919 [Ipomoea batatas]